jgi:hypothetical protein
MAPKLSTSHLGFCMALALFLLPPGGQHMSIDATKDALQAAPAYVRNQSFKR